MTRGHPHRVPALPAVLVALGRKVSKADLLEAAWNLARQPASAAEVVNDEWLKANAPIIASYTQKLRKDDDQLTFVRLCAELSKARERAGARKLKAPEWPQPNQKAVCEGCKLELTVLEIANYRQEAKVADAYPRLCDACAEKEDMTDHDEHVEESRGALARHDADGAS